jgi:hydroxymethylglutaryl-CoA synthase
VGGQREPPYAVKPTGTIVAEAIGAVPATLAADLEFACKAGTEALQAAIGLVGSGMVAYAIGVGMDTAQGRPGDALEYTAGAGGAAFVIGRPRRASPCWRRRSPSSTDTPTSARQHATTRARGALHRGARLLPARRRRGPRPHGRLGSSARDYAHAVFHQPNTKFPAKAARDLGFTADQLRLGMLANEIGNTYAGAAILGLTAILDEARPGDRILVVSFGSGAGSDAFSLRVTERIGALPRDVPTTRQYVERAVPLDYAGYARNRRKIAVD